MQNMKPRSVLLAGAFLIASVTVLAYQLVQTTSPADASSDPNGQVAYEESASAPRREAAVLAIARQGRQSVSQLRTIARDDPEPTVRAGALGALGEHYDYRSMDLLLERLESASPVEQARARSAVVRMLGPRLVPQTGDKAERERIAARAYRRLWQNMKGSDHFRRFSDKLDRKHGELP